MMCSEIGLAFDKPYGNSYYALRRRFHVRHLSDVEKPCASFGVVLENQIVIGEDGDIDTECLCTLAEKPKACIEAVITEALQSGVRVWVCDDVSFVGMDIEKLGEPVAATDLWLRHEGYWSLTIREGLWHELTADAAGETREEAAT